MQRSFIKFLLQVASGVYILIMIMVRRHDERMDLFPREGTASNVTPRSDAIISDTSLSLLMESLRSSFSCICSYNALAIYGGRHGNVASPASRPRMICECCGQQVRDQSLRNLSALLRRSIRSAVQDTF